MYVNKLFRKIAYDFYKRDWLKDHVSSEVRARTVIRYMEYTSSLPEDEDSPTYEEYVSEFGYEGSGLYCSYDEFISNEYSDIRSMYYNGVTRTPEMAKYYIDDVLEILSGDERDRAIEDMYELSEEVLQVTQKNEYTLVTTKSFFQFPSGTETSVIFNFLADEHSKGVSGLIRRNKEYYRVETGLYHYYENAVTGEIKYHLGKDDKEVPRPMDDFVRNA